MEIGDNRHSYHTGIVRRYNLLITTNSINCLLLLLLLCDNDLLVEHLSFMGFIKITFGIKGNLKVVKLFLELPRGI